MIMKILIVLSVCVMYASAFYEFSKDDYTPARLMTDKEELKKRVDCLLSKQPCEKEVVAEYKKIAPDMTVTACAKCSPQFKAIVLALFGGLQQYYPEDFKELLFKYDPKGIYFDALLKGLQS